MRPESAADASSLAQGWCRDTDVEGHGVLPSCFSQRRSSALLRVQAQSVLVTLCLFLIVSDEHKEQCRSFNGRILQLSFSTISKSLELAAR